ncbi:T9SS type A sorting domain-containing protein [Owenweeksia hongkongensis]|uniref:T9SS type A sorting domain-containing protein n=1 Tax=Owenweeksia hongkongensis TaxID=253245 RepID=UPI003A8EBAE0
MVTRNLKCLFFFIVVIFSWQSMCATSPKGGEIRYTHLSVYDYEVILVLYQVPDSTVHQSRTVNLTSICFPDQTLSLSAFTPTGANAASHGGVSISDYNCVNTLTSDSLEPFAFYYRDTVTLGGKCNDFVFSYDECCRDSSINNISQAGGTGMHIHAGLNNTTTSSLATNQNTSPSFSQLQRYVFYKGISSQNYIGVTEPENDSLLVRLISALDSNGNPVNYDSGFSANSPMMSATPFLEKITPSQAGKYTVVYEVLEFRYDLLFATWIQVGSVMREVTYVVEDSIPKDLESNAFGGPNVVDTIRNVHCGDSVVSFRIDRFLAGSLTQEGTEFRILGTDTLIRPVIEAGCYNVRPDLTCDSVWLKLYKPLESNDTAYVLLKVGGDGNTLLNSCGNEFAEQDLGVLILKGCQNTSLEENISSKSFSVYPNPTKGKIMIEVDEGETPERITLFDIQGRELKSVIPQSYKTEIDISSFSKGMYLLEVKSDGLVQTRLVQKL